MWAFVVDHLQYFVSDQVFASSRVQVYAPKLIGELDGSGRFLEGINLRLDQHISHVAQIYVRSPNRALGLPFALLFRAISRPEEIWAVADTKAYPNDWDEVKMAVVLEDSCTSYKFVEKNYEYEVLPHAIKLILSKSNQTPVTGFDARGGCLCSPHFLVAAGRRR